MKKNTLVLLLLMPFFIAANPISPHARISEIYIDEQGDWVIELGFLLESLSWIDEIEIKTLTGSAYVSDLTPIACTEPFRYFDTLAVITNDNLNGQISIDPAYDYVQIVSYFGTSPEFESLAIGNYPGSFVDCANTGESIAFLWFSQENFYDCESFALDRSPTIGTHNDTSGALSTWNGRVLGLDGEPLPGGWFNICDWPEQVWLFINSDSTISERIPAKRYAFDQITIAIPPVPVSYKHYNIEPINLCLRPDTVIYQDIITTSFVTIKEQNETSPQVVFTAPNPFASSTTFYFNMSNSVESGQINLFIWDLSGNLLLDKRLPARQKTYHWHPDLTISSGVYVYRVVKNGRLLKTGRMMKL